jgi:hypothetical protein
MKPQKSLSLFSPLSFHKNVIPEPETDLKQNHSRTVESFENLNFSGPNNINYSKVKNYSCKEKILFYDNLNNYYNHKNQIRPDLYRVKKLEEMNLDCFMQEDYFFVKDSQKFKIILMNVIFNI